MRRRLYTYTSPRDGIPMLKVVLLFTNTFALQLKASPSCISPPCITLSSCAFSSSAKIRYTPGLRTGIAELLTFGVGRQPSSSYKASEKTRSRDQTGQFHCSTHTAAAPLPAPTRRLRQEPHRPDRRPRPPSPSPTTTSGSPPA